MERRRIKILNKSTVIGYKKLIKNEGEIRLMILENLEGITQALLDGKEISITSNISDYPENVNMPNQVFTFSILKK